ncbi:MAG TPA: hypothetical protein GX717_08225 [Clostridiaceae bacterium]|nr:hypothetical protein [Clostridiaceae bacterium]
MAREKKRSRKPILWIIIILLILGIFLGGKFGWFQGLLGKDDGQSETEMQTETAAEETTAATVDDQTIDITVSGDQILFEGTAVKLGDLSQKLQSVSVDKTVILTDDAAIKGTYEAVLDALNETGLSFKENTK